MNRENDDLSYTFSFPQINFGKNVRFFITYSDSLNNTYRSPEQGEYKFNYGIGYYFTEYRNDK